MSSRKRRGKKKIQDEREVEIKDLSEERRREERCSRPLGLKVVCLALRLLGN